MTIQEIKKEEVYEKSVLENNEDHEDKRSQKSDDYDCDDPEARPPKMTYIPAPDLKGKALFEERKKIFGDASQVNFANLDDVECQIEYDGTHIPKCTTFEEMGLEEILLNNIKKLGYQTPTPIQQYAAPVVKAGKDIMALAQTGTGKTAAFLLPIMSNLLKSSNSSKIDRKNPRCLLVVPTRELGIQIKDEALLYVSDKEEESALQITFVYGGTDVEYQRQLIKNGCDILIATPGRLLQFLREKVISLNSLKYFILDETDEMLNHGFIDDMYMIFDNVPNEAVKGLFSVTFPDSLKIIVKTFLNENHYFVKIGAINSIKKHVIQNFQKMRARDKNAELIKFLLKFDISEKVLVFANTIERVIELVDYLHKKLNFSIGSLHSNLNQETREKVLKKFTRGDFQILISTNLIAKGLDIPQLQCVINYELPHSIEDYIYRIGRTARMGCLGRAYSFFNSDSVNDISLAGYLVNALKEAEQEVPYFLREYKLITCQSMDEENSSFSSRLQKAVPQSVDDDDDHEWD